MSTKIHSKWVTQSQLASSLGITVSRVNNWVKRKRIESKEQHPSGKILVDKETIKVRGFAKK